MSEISLADRNDDGVIDTSELKVRATFVVAVGCMTHTSHLCAACLSELVKDTHQLGARRRNGSQYTRQRREAAGKV